jgi:small-conductance mechanosensitive channel
MERLKELFDYTIFKSGNFDLKVSSIVYLILFFLAVVIILRIVKKMVYGIKKFELSKQYAIYSLLKYFILVVAILIGMRLIDINISILLAGSAALLVGLGLGLQNLFSDFVSGIILLADSSVKVDDIIEVNGVVGKVQEIRLRTTTVLTRDDKYIILPNSDLTRHHLVNWTHNFISSRFEINVGVDYSSDVKLVMKILKDAAIEQDGVQKDPVPFVRFIEYGESSLQFSLFFWSEEVFRVENIKSEIRVRIFEIFASNNISIPFPQRVIYNK